MCASGKGKVPTLHTVEYSGKKSKWQKLWKYLVGLLYPIITMKQPSCYIDCDVEKKLHW